MSVTTMFTAPKTPQALADSALADFQAAMGKMAAAQEAIDAQQAADRQKIADLEAKLADADSAKARLARVSARFAELLS